MSELQQKRPWYTEDILYIIAEKLLAKVPVGGQIDFRHQNPYTLFMSHNEMAMRVVIAQFAKFKRIDFTKDGEGQKIEFYKNVDKSNEPQGRDFSFGGPYIVLPGMLEYIIEKGKFQVTTIETRNFLPDDHSTDINELGEMNSLKAFCALFLGKQIQIPGGLNNNIEVKYFKVDEPDECIQNNLETILAIDAIELEFSICSNFLIDCSQYKSSIIAQNTTKITIKCDFNFQSSKENRDKFAANFETFCPFLIRACPSLKYLHISIWSSFNYIYSSVDECTDNLHSTIKAMEASIKSIDIGNEHLQISIQLSLNYQELTIQNHDLSKLGSPFIVEDADANYIARSLECVDVCGRTHKLLFKIFERDEYVTVSGEEADEDDIVDRQNFIDENDDDE